MPIVLKSVGVQKQVFIHSRSKFYCISIYEAGQKQHGDVTLYFTLYFIGHKKHTAIHYINKII